MRNLKRALSLALASVMVLGLMVVGSGASYSDVTSKNNQEAIEVLQAVGIMVGDENGNFNPTANVTRNEMAVIMSNLMDYRVASYAGTSPFTDVPSWAEPYVAACWTNGITSGYTATTYGGSDSVTTSQAALMLMKALGYFQYQNDFGDDWQLETVKQGNSIDLFEDVESAVREAMTRNDVAQLVLNTLESGIVEADNDTINVSTPDGTTVQAGRVKYNFVTSGKAYATAISRLETAIGANNTSGPIVELGEKLYNGDLQKKDDGDDFGRPSAIWSYESKEIGKYADSADYTYTAAVSNKNLYSDIGSTALGSGYTFEVFNDGKDVTSDAGKPSKNSTDDYYQTAKGTLTQVFVNADDKIVTISLINGHVGEITKVEESNGEYTLTLKQYGPSNTPKYSKPVMTDRTFDTDAAGFEKGDIVVYTFASGDIQTVTKAEVVSGKVTAYKAGKNAVLDGTQYDYSKMIAQNLEEGVTDADPSVNDDFDFYLDPYGYLIAFQGKDSVDDFLYVVKAQPSVTGVDAKVVFSDGTEKVIAIDTVATTAGVEDDATTEGTYGTKGVVKTDCVYSYEEDGGVYDLTALETSKTTSKVSGVKLNSAYSGYDANGVPSNTSNTYVNIEQDSAKILQYSYTSPNWVSSGTSFTVNSNTVFVDVKDNVVYNGYKEVVDYDIADGVIVYDKDGKAEIVFISDSAVSGVDADYFYVKDGKPSVTKDGNTTYYTYKAFIDGEETEVVAKGRIADASANGILSEESVYKITKQNANGEVTKAEKVATWNNSSIYGTNYAADKDGYTLELQAASSNLVGGAAAGKTVFRYNDETIFVVIDPKDNKGTVVDTDKVYVGDISDIETETDKSAVFVLNADDKGETTPMATLVYVILQPTNATVTEPEVDLSDYYVDLSDRTDVKVYYKKGIDAPDALESLDLVIAALTQNKYTVTGTEEDSTPDKFVISAKRSENGAVLKFTYDGSSTPSTEVFVGTVDGKAAYVPTASSAKLDTLVGTTLKAGTSVKAVDKTGTTASANGGFVAKDSSISAHGFKIESGYVKVTALTETNMTSMTVAWTYGGKTVAANDYVKVGEKIVATVTLPADGVEGKTSGTIIKGSGVTAVAGNASGVTLTGGTTSAFSGGTYTVANGETAKGTLVFEYTVEATDITPVIAFTAGS